LYDTPEYKEFYGFAHPPFGLEPDPRFLYTGASHGVALQLLHEALNSSVVPCTVLTGEPGTGKAIVRLALREQLDTKTFTSLISDRCDTFEDLLRHLLSDLGVVSKEATESGGMTTASRDDLRSTLLTFFHSLAPIQGRVVVMVSNADKLSRDLLGELNDLRKEASHDAPRVHIVLSGPPRLLDVVADVRALSDHTSPRAQVSAFDRHHSDAYIAHRLSVAGGTTVPTFQPAALEAIHTYTNGVPRSINLLCDGALTLGGQLGIKNIGVEIVDEAAQGLALLRPKPKAWWKRLFSL
jgi:general secretion pathway protein A